MDKTTVLILAVGVAIVGGVLCYALAPTGNQPAHITKRECVTQKTPAVAAPAAQEPVQTVVYHDKLIEGTILQFHWAGRSSRGAAQFNGVVLDGMLRDAQFQNVIDLKKSSDFHNGVVATIVAVEK